MLFTCSECGKLFDSYDRSKEGRQHRFCSRKCYIKWWHREVKPKIIEKVKEVNSSRIPWNKGVQSGTWLRCIVCGKPFYRFPSEKKLVCSFECSLKRPNKGRFKKGTPQPWKRGNNNPSKRPDVKEKILAHTIKAMANPIIRLRCRIGAYKCNILRTKSIKKKCIYQVKLLILKIKIAIKTFKEVLTWMC